MASLFSDLSKSSEKRSQKRLQRPTTVSSQRTSQSSKETPQRSQQTHGDQPHHSTIRSTVQRTNPVRPKSNSEIKTPPKPIAKPIEVDSKLEVRAFTQTLLDQKLVTESQIRRALKVQKCTRQRIGETLAALGYLSQTTLYRNLSSIPDAPSQANLTELDSYNLDLSFVHNYATPGFRVIRLTHPKNIAKAVILAVEPSAAMTALQSHYQHDEIQHVSYSNLCKLFLKKAQVAYEKTFYKVTEVWLTDDTQDPKRFLESLVNLAATLGASDIHIEPDGNICRIRIRIDGLLQPIGVFRTELFPALLQIIKQECKIPASQVNQKPIDGKFVHHLAFLSIDIRVSLIPSIKSASASSCVMRLLGISADEISLEQLGMEEQQTSLWRRWLKNYSGIIVISGPTGAGKTTTIYSALTEVINPDINIVTVEDPVERQLELAKQVQVTRDVLEFEEVLRAFMRHDPDVIVVGEIRDEASAKIAFEAALTGHLVITTIHANSALGIIPRLKKFGIDDLSLQEALKGLTGQRLVRKVCPYCAELTEIPEEFLGLVSEITSQRKGRGCSQCNETGYLGRTLITEMLPFGITDLDLQYTADFSEMQKCVEAASSNTKVLTLIDHARMKILNGETTVEELYRVL